MPAKFANLNDKMAALKQISGESTAQAEAKLSGKENSEMSPREQWIMAAIAAAGAFWAFGSQALYLYALAGVIFFILKNRT
ncbi:MAG: hypothetical protein VX733_10580 [Candidatus Latescibacterota bacterium]|nr:hypothetical protein [Candidatus Latescibacterota bacterium]